MSANSSFAIVKPSGVSYWSRSRPPENRTSASTGQERLWRLHLTHVDESVGRTSDLVLRGEVDGSGYGSFVVLIGTRWT
jgi:hypothetical protein